MVAGVERYPAKITRRMSKTRQEKRSKVKPFIKIINYNHLMPTRYTLELEGLKGAISGDTFKEVSQREDAKKTVKKVLEERYTSGKNRWFFTPLSTSRMQSLCRLFGRNGLTSPQSFKVSCLFKIFGSWRGGKQDVTEQNCIDCAAGNIIIFRTESWHAWLLACSQITNSFCWHAMGRQVVSWAYA